MGKFYHKIENLVSKDTCEILAGAFLIMENHTPPENMGDSIEPGAFARHGYTASDSLMCYIKPKIEEVVGRKLLPTFSYCRIYRNGHRLPAHVDRESCEVAVSLNLKNDGVPWPITIVDEDVFLNQGDAVVYEGTKMRHVRKPFEGNEHINVFLCYVFADGENTHLKYDKRLDTFDPF